MRFRSFSVLYLLLLIVFVVDCYADDLLGFTGIQPDIMFGLSGRSLLAYILVWYALIAFLVWILFKLQSSFAMKGNLRLFSYALIIFAAAVMISNNSIRLNLALQDSVVDQETVPPLFFVETYMVRLIVYAMISVVSLAIIANIGRLRITLAAKIGSYLLAVTVLATSIGFILGGLSIISQSPYWDGDSSFIHGQVYMGTFSREYTRPFEPLTTFIMLFSLGLVGAEILRKEIRNSELLFPPVILFLCIFLQMLPRLETGLVTEALYSSDFYYAFRLDRSLSFPAIPWLMFSLGIVIARVLKRNLE